MNLNNIPELRTVRLFLWLKVPFCQGCQKTDRSSVYQLTSNNQSILPISYPILEEIGSDRIANSIAAFKSFELPAIIIDLGTAATFDLITVDGGYEGGIIIPGPQGMLDFLGNHTALLPKLH